MESRASAPGAGGERSSESPYELVTVIVTYNSAAVIDTLLRSLGDSSSRLASSRINLRTIVVDNGSSDETLAIVREHPRAELVETGSNKGYAAGINQGAEHARRFDGLLVVNPDVVVNADAICALVGALQGSVGIAVPQVRGADGGLWKTLRRDPTIMRALGEGFLTGRMAGRWSALGEMERRDKGYLEPHDVDWASGSIMLISNRCWIAVGRWDESFFLYSEEVDYAIRAREAGFSVRYVPTAVVTHAGGESFTSPQLRSIQALNRVRLYGRRHGTVSTALFYAATLLNEARRARNPACRASTVALLSRRRRPEVVGTDRLVFGRPTWRGARPAAPSA